MTQDTTTTWEVHRLQPTREMGLFLHLWWAVHLDAAPAYLSQLHLQLVLHLCLLGNAGIEG